MMIRRLIKSIVPKQMTRVSLILLIFAFGSIPLCILLLVSLEWWLLDGPVESKRRTGKDQ